MKIFQLFRGQSKTISISSHSSRASSASSSSSCCSASVSSAASSASVADGDYYNEEEGELLQDDEEEITDLDELLVAEDDESRSLSDSCTDRSSQSYTDESQTSTDEYHEDEDDSFRWQKIASVLVHGSMSFSKSKSSPRSRCRSEEGEEVVMEGGGDEEEEEEEEDVDDEDNHEEEAEETELEEDDETDFTDSSMPTIPSVLHTTMSKEALSGYRPKNDKYTPTSTTGRIDIDDVIDNWKSMEKQLLLGAGSPSQEGEGEEQQKQKQQQQHVKFCDDVTLPPVDLDELRAVLERDDRGEIERLYDAIVKSRTTNDTISEAEEDGESEFVISDDNNDGKTSSSKLQREDDITAKPSNYIEVVDSVETYDSLTSKIEHLVDCFASLEGASTLLTTMGGSSEDADNNDGHPSSIKRQPRKDVVAEVQSELTQRLLTNNAAAREAEKVEKMQTEVKTKKIVEAFACSKRPSSIFKVVAEVQSELTQRLLSNNAAVQEDKTRRMKTKKKVEAFTRSSMRSVGIFESAAAFAGTGKYRKNMTTKMEQPTTPSTMPPPCSSIEPSIVSDSPPQDKGKQVTNTSKVTSLRRTHSILSTADTACTINGIEVEGISRNKSFQPFRDKGSESTKSSRLREKVDSHKKDEIVEPDRPSLHLSKLKTRLDLEEGGSLWDDDKSRKSKTPRRIILLEEDVKIVTKKSSRGGVNRKSRMGASPSSRRLNGYNLSNVSEDKEYISPTNSAIVKPPLEGKPINPEKIQDQERTCDESSIKKSKESKCVVQSELTQRLLTNNAAAREAEKVEKMQTEVKTKKIVEAFACSKRPSSIFKVVAEVQSELTQRLLSNNAAVQEDKTRRMKTKKKVEAFTRSSMRSVGIFESAAAFAGTGKYRKNMTTKMEQPTTPSTMPPPCSSIEPSIVSDSPPQDKGKQVTNTSKVTSLRRTHSILSTADTACTINGIEVEGISRNKSFQPFRDKGSESTKSSRLREKVDSHKKDEIVEPDRPSLHLSKLKTRLDLEEGGSLWDDDKSRKSKTPRRIILLEEDVKIVTKKSSRGGVNRKSRMGASPSSRRLNGYNLSNVSEDKEYISPTNSAIVKPPLEGKPINPEKIQDQERTCDESSIKKSKESKCVKSLEVKIKPITHISPEIEVAGDSDRVRG